MWRTILRLGSGVKVGDPWHHRPVGPVGDVVVVVLVSALAGWALLVVALARVRPGGMDRRELLALLPDLLRLVRRLARDRSVPRGVRVRLWLLLAYLVSPLDLVPDVVPVVGVLDDVLVTLLVLRSVGRAAGPEVLERHWPGGPAGLAALQRLVGSAG